MFSWVSNGDFEHCSGPRLCVAQKVYAPINWESALHASYTQTVAVDYIYGVTQTACKPRGRRPSCFVTS